VSTADGDLLIENVTVIDGFQLNPSRDQSVLVLEGRIDHVGPPTDRTRAWTGARISGRDRWLVPGLIDLHNHSTEIADMRCYVANGVTTVRFAGIDTPSFVDLKERITAEAIPAPSLLTCGPMLDSNPPSWPQWARVVSDPSDAKHAAHELLEAEHVDGLFGVHGLTADLLRPIVEAAQEHARPVVGQLWQVDASECAELGVRQLDNTSRVFATSRFSVEELIRPRPVSDRLAVLARAWVAVDWDQTEALMGSMVGAEVAYCPTLAVWEYLAEVGRNNLESDPDFTTFFGHDERANFASLAQAMNGTWSAEDRYYWRAALENRYEWVRRFHAMGGQVVLGTDIQFGGIEAHRELSILVECGLSPAEAIAAGTGTAARVAGQPAIGRIVQGAVGDLLLLEADPLTDIGNLRRIEGLIRGGVVSRPDDLRVAL